MRKRFSDQVKDIDGKNAITNNAIILEVKLEHIYYVFLINSFRYVLIERKRGGTPGTKIKYE